jgi:Cu-processing system ATP-binding protein
MIAVEKLEKRFGRQEVLRGIDLHINPGRITAVLGPNGSGKTTLIKSILGLVRPDSGRIDFSGQPVRDQWLYRELIGYLPQIARFPENLTVREVIGLVAGLRKGKPEPESLLRLFRVEDTVNRQLRNLSGGTRQKVNLVLALMYDCPVYILDEPTSGLDPVALIRLKELIRNLREKGKTILITTHIMNLVEEICDELAFLLEGRIYFRGTPAELMELHAGNNLEASIAGILAKYDV